MLKKKEINQLPKLEEFKEFLYHNLKKVVMIVLMIKKSN